MPFPALWTVADQAGLIKTVNGEDILMDISEQDTVIISEAPSPVQEDTCREKSQRREGQWEASRKLLTGKFNFVGDSVLEGGGRYHLRTFLPGN